MTAPPSQPVGHKVALPVDQIAPRPTTAQSNEPEDDGQPGADVETLGEPRLVYPGETIRLSTTLAVLLPEDEKESYFGAAHVAIVQPEESFEGVGSRLLRTVNDLVIANVDECLESLTTKFGNTPPADDDQDDAQDASVPSA